MLDIEYFEVLIQPEDLELAWKLKSSKIDTMLNAVKDKDIFVSRALAIYLIHRFKFICEPDQNLQWYGKIETLKQILEGKVPEEYYEELGEVSDPQFVKVVIKIADDIDPDFAEILKEYSKNYLYSVLESLEVTETYSKEELDNLLGKVYNLQKIDNIYRRKKYGDERLFAKTICTKCGREKKVFLSNLINDPEKYGSCICSETNIDAKIDNISKLYSGSKKLKSNTSGYTGVSYVKTYKGEPYDKWRAYIEVDGKRTYLGDFDFKKDAIKARKEAGEKGIKWYKENRNKMMRDVRKKTKKYATSKYRDSKRKTINFKKEK